MSNQVNEEAALAAFYDLAYIADVPRVVKSGKEATVYCCPRRPSRGSGLFAAKVYRALRSRSFRNDAIYQQGRVILDARAQRAYSKKTRTGQHVQFNLWVSHEYATMKALYAAGGDVPSPVAHSGSAILMDYIGDEASAAPPLSAVALAQDEAPAVFGAIMRNVELLLAHNCIHADLSAFNVLYWRGSIRIIDFPQTVDPRTNSNAYSLLTRDIENICRHFARYDLRHDAHLVASQLWARWLRAEL